ncbi:Uracil-DNA glycosylase [Mycena indigotica]|uniref:Uracil-DNA glycosylase n=1 Tax=Mycena indigotica TaxID=2126181 RepID=A0A8H6T8W9_9AGAR|nr:Uracil-DNA glycosylase [Mycena indigotica]KAF7312117.1 Uracil-DNA glycosylase [Mycena indigotica]
MSNPNDSTVYLEDLATNYKRPKRVADSEAEGTTAGKRQKTLFESFGPEKRQKLSQPKPTCSTGIRAPVKGQKLNSIPFSLSAFQAALPDDEARKLLALECETFGKSWFKVMATEFVKPYFIDLKRQLYEEGVCGATDPVPATIFPPPKNIYTWSDTPLGRVKVVIIGQDPYITKGQAHGLSFSVPQGVHAPPSLQNIFKELKNEYPSFTPPGHGTLTKWAEQGVLLLNTVLTVKAGVSDSHAGRGWEQFTERVMQIVDAYGGANLARPGEAAAGVGTGVVIIAWGSKAQQRVKGLDSKKHLILKSVHPSPRSADSGFFGNGHFRKANDWLEARYGAGGGIDWCAL